MLDDMKGWGQETITLEQHAYREAGHAVMYFLLKTGRATEYNSVDQSGMLTPFPGIRAAPHAFEWGELTSNLGSMLTSAQILLAGWVAQNMKFLDAQELNLEAPRVKMALHMCSAYAEEYVSDTDFAKRDRAAMEWLVDMHQHIRQHLQTSWKSVEALAQAIQTKQRDISEAETFELIKTAAG